MFDFYCNNSATTTVPCPLVGDNVFDLDRPTPSEYCVGRGHV